MPPVRILWLTAACLAAACAHPVPPSGPDPADLSALEARRAAHPGDPRTLADVGEGFYRAGAYDRARDVLTAALVLNPRNFTAAVHLGLADEALGDYTAALAAYHAAEALKISGAERRIVEQRLVGLTHQRLALMARQAIAQEQAVAARPAPPNTIAVLPWTYLGVNPELQPLGRGLAELFLSDLAKLPRYTLLERERAQSMIDELALSASANVAPGTAARSGRLLGAEQVLSGAFRETDDGSIRLDANVVRAATAEVRAAGNVSDRLEQLIEMEKELLFDLLARMAVALSPAERSALAERPTADIQAFLAFSRGLNAEDHGDFGAAAEFFNQAAAKDPAFDMARERATRSARLQRAGRVTTARLSALADRSGRNMRRAQLAAALQTIAPTFAGRLNRANRPNTRSRLAEALRQDDASRIGLTSLGITIIPRP